MNENLKTYLVKDISVALDRLHAIATYQAKTVVSEQIYTDSINGIREEFGIPKNEGVCEDLQVQARELVKSLASKLENLKGIVSDLSQEVQLPEVVSNKGAFISFVKRCKALRAFTGVVLRFGSGKEFKRYSIELGIKKRLNLLESWEIRALAELNDIFGDSATTYSNKFMLLYVDDMREIITDIDFEINRQEIINFLGTQIDIANKELEGTICKASRILANLTSDCFVVKSDVSAAEVAKVLESLPSRVRIIYTDYASVDLNCVDFATALVEMQSGKLGYRKSQPQLVYRIEGASLMVRDVQIGNDFQPCLAIMSDNVMATDWIVIDSLQGLDKE